MESSIRIDLPKSKRAVSTKKTKPSQYIPKNWEGIWEGIAKVRKEIIAPVDALGCEELVRDYDKNSANEKAYHQLVGLMLSAQTKDEVTHSTLRFLVEHKDLSIETILKTKESDLNSWISKVGFHNKKAVYIKKTTEKIKNDHDGIVPDNLEDLVALPGVGLKMAHLLLQGSFDKVEGISVDTHVHRIANRLKWVRKPTTNPDVTGQLLEEWVPKDKWRHINPLLVGFGQTICKPVGPRCWECPVKKLCPFGHKNLNPPVESKRRPQISEQI